MMPRRLLLLSLVALLGLAACQPTGKGDAQATTTGDGAADAAGATPIPQIVSKDGRHALMVDGAPFLILDCNAPQAVITSWLAQRQADKNDPSDATLTVIEEQQANRDPLTAEELLHDKKICYAIAESSIGSFSHSIWFQSDYCSL